MAYSSLGLFVFSFFFFVCLRVHSQPPPQDDPIVSLQSVYFNFSSVNFSHSSISSPSPCCSSVSLPRLPDSFFSSSTPTFTFSTNFSISSSSPNWTRVFSTTNMTTLPAFSCQINLTDITDQAYQSTLLAASTAASQWPLSKNGAKLLDVHLSLLAVGNKLSTAEAELAYFANGTSLNESIYPCEVITINYISSLTYLSQWSIPLSAGINYLTLHNSSSLNTYSFVVLQPTPSYPFGTLNLSVALVNLSMSYSSQRDLNNSYNSNAYIYSLRTDFAAALNLPVSRIYITSPKFNPNISSLLFGVIDNVTAIISASSQSSSLKTTLDYAQLLINYFSTSTAQRSNAAVWKEVQSASWPATADSTSAVVLTLCDDGVNYYQTPPAGANVATYCSVSATTTTTASPTTSTTTTASFSSGKSTTLYFVVPLSIGVVLCVLVLLCVCYQVQFEREKQRKQLESAVMTMQQSELKESFRTRSKGGDGTGSGAVHEGGTGSAVLHPFQSTMNLMRGESMRKVGKPRGKDKNGFAPQEDVDEEFFLESAGDDPSSHRPHSALPLSLTNPNSTSSSSSAKKFSFRGMTKTQMEERRTQLMDLEIAREAQRKIWKEAESKGKGKKKGESAEEEEEETEEDERVEVVVAETAEAQRKKSGKGKSKLQKSDESDSVEMSSKTSKQKKRKEDNVQSSSAKSKSKSMPFPGAEEDGIAQTDWVDVSPSSVPPSSTTSSYSSSSSKHPPSKPSSSPPVSPPVRSAPSKFYADEEDHEDETQPVKKEKPKDKEKGKGKKKQVKEEEEEEEEHELR